MINIIYIVSLCYVYQRLLNSFSKKFEMNSSIGYFNVRELGQQLKKDTNILTFKNLKNFKYAFCKKHTQQQKLETLGQWITHVIPILVGEVVTGVVFA